MDTFKPRFLPPYYGAAYYPEDWPDATADRDIELMLGAGVNVARMAEFAWARMEPREGDYQFGWLERAVEKLADAGIASVLGTPSATPPVWLVEKHPEVLFVQADGHRIGHGGRRHTCPNNPVYRDYSVRVAEKMADAFGQDDRVVAWQIDNEVFPHYDFSGRGGMFTRACCCPVCMDGFHAWLEERFGTVDALNQAWCLDLWSQRYDRFDQVPAPDNHIWHHPSLLASWDRFNSESYVAFVAAQARAIRARALQPIGTDMMPFFELDHYAMNRELDVVQFNHYYMNDLLRQVPLYFDYLRPAKDRPWWNTETSPGCPGNHQIAPYCAPGFCRANSWLPFALGAEANLFWLWRSHWNGQELMMGGVVTTEGRPSHHYDEMREVSAGLKNSADFLRGTRPVQTGLAIHAGFDPAVLFRSQPVMSGFNYVDSLQHKVYQPLIRKQYRPDVIAPGVDLDPYRLLVSCFLPDLSAGGLRDRLQAWIEAGGIWVAGPFTDIRDGEGGKFLHAPFGILEEWAGVHCKYQIPGSPKGLRYTWADGAESEGQVWHCGFEPAPGTEILATFREHWLDGLAAVVERPMGKGAVVLLGTMPDPEAWVRLVDRLAERAGVRPAADASVNVMAAPRTGGAGSGLVAVEMENKEGWCAVPGPGVDLVSGNRVEGRVELLPYGVLVYKADA
jgi:beta-galactosidase